LADYEWSLYIDATVALTADPNEMLAAYAPAGASFFAFPSPWRACLYDEAEEVIRLDYDDERRVREQIDHYREMGFPRHAGLIAGGVLLRRHNDPELIAVAEEWYEHVLRFSKRDQLSFNFVAWRRGFKHAILKDSLLANPYVAWPARKTNKRVAADFDPFVYAWLNPEVERSGLSPQEHFLEARKAGNASRIKRYSWQLRKLANKYRSDKGSIYYSAHGYADIYENMLRQVREKPIKLLELGLLRHDLQRRNPGGPYADASSLAMWRDYLPNATIYGFAIADFATAAEVPGVSIIRGDMGSLADLERLLQISGGNFDIIIDDASHASHHQQIALGFLFPHLKPGGYYFIEDLNYQPPAWEIRDAVKTRSVLDALAKGRQRPTPYIDHAALTEIDLNLDWIKTFDSFDRSLCRIHRDAFAVLKKSSTKRVRNPSEAVAKPSTKRGQSEAVAKPKRGKKRRRWFDWWWAVLDLNQ
jgi:hypothetical protein